ICRVGRTQSLSGRRPAFLANSGASLLRNVGPTDSALMDPCPSPSERSGPGLPPALFSSAPTDLERRLVSGFPDDRQFFRRRQAKGCGACTAASPSKVQRAGHPRNKCRLWSSAPAPEAVPDWHSQESSIFDRSRSEEVRPESVPELRALKSQSQ